MQESKRSRASPNPVHSSPVRSPDTWQVTEPVARVQLAAKLQTDDHPVSRREGDQSASFSRCVRSSHCQREKRCRRADHQPSPRQRLAEATQRLTDPLMLMDGSRAARLAWTRAVHRRRRVCAGAPLPAARSRRRTQPVEAPAGTADWSSSFPAPREGLVNLTLTCRVQ